VLPAPHRLTRGADLRRVSRAGRRSGGGLLVLHLLTLRQPPADQPPADQAIADPSALRPPRIGFVVSRAVGNAVLRHRVQRRLRHLCRDRLAQLPPGSELVVRALPASAEASYSELGAELDRCLERVLPTRPGAVS
jgi:ribonuclease P protein component